MKTLMVYLAVLSSALQGYWAGALRLLGLSTAEDLSEEQVENIEFLHLHPLQVNYCTRNQFMDSGLLSAFQVAGILDHISRNGPILSLAELSVVPGIGADRARDLSWFVSFDCESPYSGGKGGRSLRYDVSMTNNVSGKALPDGESQLAGSSVLRARAAGLRGAGVGVSVRETLSSAYLSYEGHRWVDRVVVGNFNVRWGQGLTVWSGMTLAGVSSVDAFCRNPTGLSPTASSFPKYRGIAVMGFLGTMSMQWFWSEKGTLGLHLEHLGSSSLWGISAVKTRDFYSVGADCKGTAGKMTLFAEGVVQMRPFGNVSVCGVGGAMYNIGYKRRAGLLLRSYSTGFDSSMSGAVRWSGKCSDQTGVSAGLQWGDFMFVADYSRKVSQSADRMKVRAGYSTGLQAGEWSISPKVEYQFKYDGGARNEIRCEGDFERSPILMKARVQLCAVGRQIGVLAALQGGIRTEGGTALLRGVYFNTPSWKSRLYCYSRDVPGSLCVPAYYGEGFELSLYAGCRLVAGRVCYTSAHSRYRRIELKLYLRIG